MADRRRAPSASAPPDSGVDLLASPLVYDKSAEHLLVAAVLIQPDRAGEIVGAVRASDFHGFLAREVYTSMQALVERGESPDVMNVWRDLYARKVHDVNLAEVTSLTDGMPLGVDWHVAAHRVREGATRRRLASSFAKFIERVTTDPLDELRRDGYELIDQCDASRRPASQDRWEVVASEVAARYDMAGDETIPSGLTLADAKFGQIPRGSFCIIGARTSVGKTAMATTLAQVHGLEGRRTSIVSREMERFWIAHRIIGAMTGNDVKDAVNRCLIEGDLDKFFAALRTQMPLCIDDQVKTWSEARARIRQHARELGGLDNAFIDYVQLLDPEQRPGEKRYEAIGRVSAGMKDLARELRCNVWALAQLNRGADEREEPRVSDLRESGNLEQDADVIWLLWNHSKDRPLVPGTIPVRVRVAKFRNSSTGEITVAFRRSATAFEEYREEEEDEHE